MLRFLIRTIAVLSTIILLAIAGLAFSPLPHRAQNWLKTSVRSGVNPPKTMVVLGGGGIPSKSGLLRCYTAAELYAEHSGIRVIVSLPSDEDPDTSATGAMRDELILRGVPANNILMESKGRNTAEQAAEVATLVGEEGLFESTLVVTDPTHMRRALLSFRKAGFVDLQSGPSRNEGVDADLGSNTQWRYGFWNNLHLEVDILREYIALQWYKYKKWN